MIKKKKETQTRGEQGSNDRRNRYKKRKINHETSEKSREAA